MAKQKISIRGKNGDVIHKVFGLIDIFVYVAISDTKLIIP